MFSDRSARGILNHITNTSTIFAAGTAFLALLTTAPTSDSGAGAVEVSTSGTAYARQSTAGIWTAASGSGPSTTQTNAQISFPTATGAGFGTIVAWGLYDASSAGNLLYWDWLGNYAWEPVTINAASPAIFTVGQSGFYTNGLSAVLDVANRFGGEPPTYSAGSPTVNTVLTVASPSGFTFQLQNGVTSLACSAAGSSSVRLVQSQAIPAGITTVFPSGSFVLAAT